MTRTTPWKRFLRTEWPLVCALLFALGEWSHLLLDKTVAPASLDSGAPWLLDAFFHVSGVPLKLLTLGGVIVALSRVLERCRADVRASLFVGGVWLLSAMALLGGLSAARAPLSRLLNNSAEKFYPTNAGVLVDNPWGEGARRFVTRWASGEIIASEALLLVVSILGLVALGYLLGHEKRILTTLITLWLPLILFGGGIAFSLVSAEADAYLAGTLFGPLIIDVSIPFMPSSSSSPLTSLVYVLMIGGARFSRRVLERTASPEGQPLSVGTAPGAAARLA